MGTNLFMVTISLREQKNLNLDKIRQIPKSDPHTHRLRLFFGGYDHTDDPIYIEETVKKWCSKLIQEQPELLLYMDMPALNPAESTDDSLTHVLATQTTEIEYVKTDGVIGAQFFITPKQANQFIHACKSHAKQWNYDMTHTVTRILHHIRSEDLGEIQ